MKKLILLILSLVALKSYSSNILLQKDTIKKNTIGIVIYSNDPETVYNAFRFANFALSQKETVKIFLLGKGVEVEAIVSEKFNIKEQMKGFVKDNGEILSCGSCLKIRKASGTELCPASTMADLYAIIKQSEKIMTF